MNKVLSGIGFVAAARTSVGCVLTSPMPGIACMVAAFSVLSALTELMSRSHPHTPVNPASELVQQIPCLITAGLACLGAGLLAAVVGGWLTACFIQWSRAGQKLSNIYGMSFVFQLSLICGLCRLAPSLLPGLLLTVPAAICATLCLFNLIRRNPGPEAVEPVPEGGVSPENEVVLA